jgi:hypothetical protein
VPERWATVAHGAWGRAGACCPYTHDAAGVRRRVGKQALCARRTRWSWPLRFWILEHPVSASPAYHPFYCEENVARWLGSSSGERYALFITNAARQVPLWEQRLSSGGDPLIWDYHVVGITRSPERVWDFDSRLPFPSPLEAYLRATFPPLPVEAAALTPKFRLVDAESFTRTFATDRRHMRRADGSWMQSPPPWPVIGVGHTLDRFLDLDDSIAGEVLSLEGLRKRLGAKG